MKNLRRILPVSLAIAFGFLTLLGLLFVPAVGSTLTGWAAFLAAVALLLGVFNLLGVHVRRLSKGNIYSGVLVLSMLIIFFLAVADYFELIEGGVDTAFQLVQVPLEAAMASLLAFFLLFAGARVLQRQQSLWAVLFVIVVLLVLLGRSPLPGALGDIFEQIGDFISDIFVNAGMRGILIGVALGTITVALRLLLGWERPYDK